MKKKIILVLSFLLLAGWGTCPVKAADDIPVVETSNSLSFGANLAALEDGSTSSGQSLYASMRLVVKMKSKIANCEDFFGQYNATKIIAGPDGLYGLQFDTIFDTKQAAERLNKLNDVAYAEPDYKSSATETTAQKLASLKKYHPISDGSVRLGSVGFAQQLLKVTSNTSLKVAVLDSGIRISSSLRPRVLKSEGYNFIDRTTDTMDRDGHGTHVAGIIWDMTYGLDVKLLPVKVLDDTGEGDTFALVAGINYAIEKGAKVINISINLELAKDNIHSEYVHDAIKTARKKGIVVVCSAGNDNTNVKNTCPADLEEPIVVGAVDSNDRRADFSNYGKTLDVVAPGVNIRSMGLIANDVYMSGTSMAAPHVTGVVAMLRLMYPSYGPTQIDNFLKTHSEHLGGSDWNEKYGYGIPSLTRIKTYAAQKVSLNSSTKTITATTTASLEAMVSPDNATLKTVTWKSSNPKVAAVSRGVVVGVAPGTADITATTTNGKKAVCKVTVKAASMMPRTSFSLKSYQSTKKQAVIEGGKFKDSEAIQIQLQDANKKTIATVEEELKNESASCTFSKLSNQKIYYYRARAIYMRNGVKTYSAWSYRRVFSTVSPVVKLAKNKKSVSIQTSKLTGISKYDVYLSLTNKEGSEVKVKTVTAGQTYSCSSFKGKALTSYGKQQTFYVLLKPVYTKKEMEDTKYIRTKFTLK